MFVGEVVPVAAKPAAAAVGEAARRPDEDDVDDSDEVTSDEDAIVDSSGTMIIFDAAVFVVSAYSRLSFFSRNLSLARSLSPSLFRSSCSFVLFVATLDHPPSLSNQ